jgi:hypothetical protein
MTQQLQFEFFWPLTEQIPLELDYTDCDRPKLAMPNNVTSGQFIISNGGTWSTSITASHLSLDIDTTTIKVKDTPNLCSRIIYKCLGLKWEKK